MKLVMGGHWLLQILEIFPNLESLFLGENSITDKGAVALIESKSFPALKILDLGKNLLGEPSALAAFQINRKGKVRVIYR